jgi:hypothetical protein
VTHSPLSDPAEHSSFVVQAAPTFVLAAGPGRAISPGGGVDERGWQKRQPPATSMTVAAQNARTRELRWMIIGKPP